MQAQFGILDPIHRCKNIFLSLIILWGFRASNPCIFNETGAYISKFPPSKQLCFWSELTSQMNISIGKKKTPKSVWPAPTSSHCLFNAFFEIRAKQFPEVRNHYLSLKKCLDHNKAIIVIAKILLTAIYNTLTKNEPYNPELCCNAHRPSSHHKVLVNEAIFFLQR